jgi:hypothetical protein
VNFPGKEIALPITLFLALISAYASGRDDRPWTNDPIVVSEQTLNNVIVVSNPNPFEVVSQ